MTATPVTPAVASIAGVTTPTLAATDHTNGNTVPNDGATLLLVQNTDVASQTMDVAALASDTVSLRHAAGYTLAASAVKTIGPFDLAYFGTTLVVTASSANVHIAAISSSGPAQPASAPAAV